MALRCVAQHVYEKRAFAVPCRKNATLDWVRFKDSEFGGSVSNRYSPYDTEIQDGHYHYIRTLDEQMSCMIRLKR